MCTMLYMASDHPLPEIPWDSDNPAFFVTSRLDPKVEAIRSILTKRYVYYVGSHQYCGCGFAYCTDEEYEHAYQSHPDDLRKALADNAHGRESVGRLREYLETAVEQGHVDLYATSVPAVATPPSHRLQVGPHYFAGDEAGITAGWFLTVRGDISTLGL